MKKPSSKWVNFVVDVDEVFPSGHIFIRCRDKCTSPFLGETFRILFVRKEDWRLITAHSLVRWTIQLNSKKVNLSILPELSPSPPKRKPAL